MEANRQIWGKTQHQKLKILWRDYCVKVPIKKINSRWELWNIIMLTIMVLFVVEAEVKKQAEDTDTHTHTIQWNYIRNVP